MNKVCNYNITTILIIHLTLNLWRERVRSALLYAYTIQGWIKGVNANSLNPANDMGGDGNNGFAEDAFGYTLHYNTNDYNAIGGSSSENFLSAVSSGVPMTNLYNGNISRMATAISENVTDGSSLNLGTQVRDFKYDELNRLVASNKISGKGASNAYATTYEYDANGNIKNLTRRDGSGLLMDDLTYHYAKDGNGNILNNRLLHVNDYATESDVTTDFKNQSDNYAQNDLYNQNYAYDKIGNLIKDEQEEIAEISWTVSGKVQEIKRKAGSTKSNLKFQYDAAGTCVSKTEIYQTVIAGLKEITTYYVRDNQKNIMAVYEKRSYENGDEQFELQEQHIYGSERIGMLQANAVLATRTNAVTIPNTNPDFSNSQRLYSLTNHLGNVLAVVSDQKTLEPDGSYKPDIKAVYDYYPFGQFLPLRHYKPDFYRFSFNGKENINEVSGWQDFGARMYNRKLARFMSPDPFIIYRQQYLELSTYLFAGNSPIQAIDLDGLKKKIVCYSGLEETGKTKIKKPNSNSKSVSYLPPELQKSFDAENKKQKNDINIVSPLIIGGEKGDDSKNLRDGKGIVPAFSVSYFGFTDDNSTTFVHSDGENIASNIIDEQINFLQNGKDTYIDIMVFGNENTTKEVLNARAEVFKNIIIEKGYQGTINTHINENSEDSKVTIMAVDDKIEL